MRKDALLLRIGSSTFVYAICTGFFLFLFQMPVVAHLLDNTTYTGQQLLIDGDAPGSPVHDGDTITGVSVSNTPSNVKAIIIQDIKNFTFKNCSVSNTLDDGIQLRRVQNVTIENCTLSNIGKNGLDLSSTLGNDTSNVHFINNKVLTSGQNGISVSQADDGNGNITLDHPGLVVRGNELRGNGTGTAYHGMYIMSTDSVIENNIVDGSSGNGLSIRSSSIVRDNIISNTYESCIKYFNDHIPGPTDMFLVENNMCYLTALGNGGAGIEFSDTNAGKRLTYYIVRFNSLYLNAGRNAFRALPDFHTVQYDIKLYGNVAVNPLGTPTAYDLSGVDFESKNFFSTNPSVFKNTSSAFDLHLAANSPAIGYATGVSPPGPFHQGVNPLPSVDIDGQIRVSTVLDAGADQVSSAGSPQPNCPMKSSGDANCDGRVTLADFEIWRREFTGEVVSKDSDYNADSRVSLADFEVWRRSFTSGSPQPT